MATNYEFLAKLVNNFNDECTKFDSKWMQRHRVLDTKLLVTIIIKLIVSKTKQGYASNLQQLWESCQLKDIDLPQITSVAASSLCESRQKLPAEIFTNLITSLLGLWHDYFEYPKWNGHRVFAVDGSKINLPRELVNYGYKVVDRIGRFYPQGTMSCLYDLQQQLIYDIEIVSHRDERACALEHLSKMNAGDIVVFDRGYFSYFMLHKILEQNVNAVFRMQEGCSNNKVKEFWDNNLKTDEVIEYIPSNAVISEIKKKGFVNIKPVPIQLRLIKHKIKDQIYIYATTLIGDNYPASEFGDLYHGRWGIEELYKISKNYIDVEDFHSKTERGIKQEIYAHALLINLSRIFEHQSNNKANNDAKENQNITDKNSFQKNNGIQSNSNTCNNFKINFKNCLFTTGRYIENILLSSVSTIESWIDTTLGGIARIRQKIRPSRSFQRISHKPRSPWNSYGKSRLAVY
mgnify:FL=1